jgi:hypothetical protein
LSIVLLDVSLSIIACIIACCLSEREKSDVECLLLAYFNAVAPSSICVQEVIENTIYQLFSPGYSLSTIVSGTLISTHHSQSINDSNPLKSINA